MSALHINFPKNENRPPPLMYMFKNPKCVFKTFSRPPIKLVTLLGTKQSYSRLILLYTCTTEGVPIF